MLDAARDRLFPRMHRRAMTSTTPHSPVTAIAPAEPDVALAHFTSLLQFETDCWDVHEAMRSGTSDFVLVDVRGAGGFAAGHVPGALSLPHAELTEAQLESFPAETVFVVYCAGPHCNGADRAAVRLHLHSSIYSRRGCSSRHRFGNPRSSRPRSGGRRPCWHNIHRGGIAEFRDNRPSA